MVRSRPPVLAVLAGALLLTLGACTAATTTAGPAVTVSPPGPPSAGDTTPGTTTPGDSAGTAPPAATPSSIIATVSANTPSFFITPSKNIGCSMTMSGARCDIGDRSWTPPPKPPSCHLDYGNGVSVSASGATVSCAGDTVLYVTTNVLAYGHGISNGQVECVSQSTGVRCEYLATGHGFTLAKEAYTLF
jgi:hypothetical protein